MTAQAGPVSNNVVANNKAPGLEYFPVSKPWRMDGDNLHLIGMSCAECGIKAFPEREICSACGSERVAPVELSSRGKLYCFSEIHVAPKDFAVPYVVAYVDLDDGVRLFGQVEGPASNLAIDQSVAVVLGPIRSRNDDGQADGVHVHPCVHAEPRGR